MTTRLPLVKHISGKSIVWFPTSNQYVIMETYDADILLKFYNNKTFDEITQWFKTNVDTQNIDTNDYLLSIQKLKDQQESFVNTKDKKTTEFLLSEEKPSLVRYYNSSGKIFRVAYNSTEMESLLHPKFEHLEIAGTTKPDHEIRVLTKNQEFMLIADGVLQGQWDEGHLHYLSGKFSMVLLSKIYGMPEDKWLAVFHASAVTDGNSTILLAGDSGNGKSTGAAVLMSHGFDLVADDFVPLDSAKKIRFFPAALSIKKKAVSILSKAFPELLNAKEYTNEPLNKTFRYITSTGNSADKIFPAKALIFINYRKNASLRLKKIKKSEGLIKLIPDTWISAKPENVNTFLDWIDEIDFYTLSYSDNNSLIESVRSIFSQ